MGLSDYEPARVEVEFKGGSFSVRGLSLDDIAGIMKNYSSDLDGMIDIYTRGVTGESAVAGIAQYAIALVKDAPGLTSYIIANAADEPESVAKVRKLSMPVQVDAMKKIAKLTFEEAGGPKKFYESLRELLQMVAPTDPAKTGSPT